MTEEAKFFRGPNPAIITPDDDGGGGVDAMDTVISPRTGGASSSLSDTRGLWMSDETDDTNILDRYLKVQNFKDIKMSSTESE